MTTRSSTKIIPIVLLFSLTFTQSHLAAAQKKWVLYLNGNFELTSKEKSTYRRELSIDPKEMVFDGDYKDYVNDVLVQEGSYSKGVKSGIHKIYKEGKLVSSIEFLGSDFNILELSDADGKQLIRDGNGEFTIPFTFVDIYFTFRQWTRGTLTGKFENGKRAGKWTYKPDHGRGRVEETYENGVFIEAKTISDRSFNAGKLKVFISPASDEIEKFNFDKTVFDHFYEYLEKFPIAGLDSLDRQVAYGGGVERLMQILQLNLKIPSEDRRIHSPTTSTVIVMLAVGIHGNVTQRKIIKPGSNSLNEEALRIIRLIEDKLCPALHLGKPFESAFSVPITIKLGF